MVVTDRPSARDTGATQERTASPSMCTVHAPHCAIPHPYLVPVRPRFSRMTHNSGVDGSTSRLTRLPFTEKAIISVLLIAAVQRMRCGDSTASSTGLSNLKQLFLECALQLGEFRKKAALNVRLVASAIRIRNLKSTRLNSSHIRIS